MNIQKKDPPIHRTVEILEEKGVVVTLCGRWVDWDEYKETQSNITCKACLKVVDEREVRVNQYFKSNLTGSPD